MSKVKGCLLVIALFASACQAVNSSELKSTAAEDLKLIATISEYKDSSVAKATAQLQTLSSNIYLDLNQGETISVSSDNDSGILKSVYLANSDFLNFDHHYDGTVAKTIEGGNYYLTYKDRDDNETTVTLPTGEAADIISPVQDATVSGDFMAVTWNPIQICGSVSISVEWSGGGAVGYSSKTCENVGSCSIDVTHMIGNGKAYLYNTVVYTNVSGFGAANIKVNNISSRNISFVSGTSTSASKSISIADDSEKQLTAQEILDKCERYCEEGETATFKIGEENYSCCI